MAARQERGTFLKQLKELREERQANWKQLRSEMQANRKQAFDNMVSCFKQLGEWQGPVRQTLKLLVYLIFGSIGLVVVLAIVGGILYLKR